MELPVLFLVRRDGGLVERPTAPFARLLTGDGSLQATAHN